MDNTAMVFNSIEKPNRYSYSTTFNGQFTTFAATSSQSSSIKENELDGMYTLRKSLIDFGISEQTANLVLQGWRDGTQKQYSSFIKQWVSFCIERKENPILSNVVLLLEFLQSLYQSGKSYSC